MVLPNHGGAGDPDSRLYRKGKTASELRFMGHTLMENRNGLIVDAAVKEWREAMNQFAIAYGDRFMRAAM